jgi:hypothetical protein
LCSEQRRRFLRLANSNLSVEAGVLAAKRIATDAGDTPATTAQRRVTVFFLPRRIRAPIYESAQ